MSIPRWSLRNPAIVVLAMALFAAWGLANYLGMSRREDPEIKVAMALVITIYPGAGADKVEQQVTRKLEESIESMNDLKAVDSTSRPNLSVITVQVEYDADTDVAWQVLRDRVAEAKADLPATVIGPRIWDSFGDTTGMIVAFSGTDPVELGRLARDLRAELRSVRSVGEMTLFGERPEVVYVEGTRADMARAGVGPYQIAQALSLHNLRIPGGAIRTDRYQYRIEPSGEYATTAAIADTILDVSTESGQPLHVRDLFTVRRTIEEPATKKVLVDGRDAVALGIVMKRGFNIVEMGRDVRAALAAFASRVPAGVKMEVVHDSPRQVNGQVGRFSRNLLEGIAIVVFVMAVFMGLKSAAISATAIPLSVLIALSFMPALRIDLEIVSIASFIVALGMLVDDSIVIADNIDIKLRQGLPPHEAAARGADELFKPVLVGTVGTIISFMPMLLLPEEVGAYVRSLPLVVSLSLFGSLIVSTTVTPNLAKRMLRRKPGKVEVPYTETRIARAYTAFMARVLAWRWGVVAAAIAAFAGAIYLFATVGFSFFPDAERDQAYVDVWLPEGASTVETERVARLAEAKLHADPDVVGTVVFVGEGGPRFYITVMPEFQSSNYAQILINTKSAGATAGVVERFNVEARSGFPGARVAARKLIMGMPFAAPVELRIVGNDFAELKRIGAQVQEILRGVPGATQIRDDVGPDVPSLKVDIDAERANRVGVTNTDVALAFLSTYEGFELTRFSDGEEEVPILLRLADRERTIQEDLRHLPVASAATGAKVPLGGFADVVPAFSPGVIRRHNNQRALTVQAWNEGRLANDVVGEALPKVRALELPPGYSVDAAGEKQEMDKTFNRLVVIFGVIIVGLVGLLVLQLSTIRRTLIVLISVPLSSIGAAIALKLGGYSFSFMAFLGVISLAGLAIRNTVVWIEFVEHARGEGAAMADAVIRAGIYRLRPILLTTVTTIGGLVPLALFGGALFEPMAWAIIVGLALVTVFTLIVIPVCYALMMPDRHVPIGGGAEP
jgi:multidrug efflux pump subunit AcrB